MIATIVVALATFMTVLDTSIANVAVPNLSGNLGVSVDEGTWVITIFAAANAVSSLVTVRQPGASLLPQIDDLRIISVTVAVAVAEAASREGLARVRLHDVVQQVHDAMWQPEYRRIEAI